MTRSNVLRSLVVLTVPGIIWGASAPQSPASVTAAAKKGIDRTVLPVPEPAVATINDAGCPRRQGAAAL